MEEKNLPQSILRQGLERFAQYYSSQTNIGTFRSTGRGSLLNEGLSTRANSIWKMAEYVIATYDNTEHPTSDYLNGWRVLASNFKNQYLFLETAPDNWELYDSQSQFLGGNSLILSFLESKYLEKVKQESKYSLTSPNHNLGPLQQIFFGAPGTGKSHSIKEACRDHEHFRITFHPDTDYASFVGAYKPFTESENVYHTMLTQKGVEALPVINPETNLPLTTTRIIYKFVHQAFLKAYVAAWREQEKEEPQPVFLVIEEINRGNCAQIFGDIFQLLDRNEEGFSDYPIHADTDLSKELGKVFADLKVANADGINALYEDKDVVGEVKKGTQMLLPNNLYIWATMNTSDQSLFPIDSAFKRRWDWKYIKIADSGKGYVISVNGKEYDWWEFLKAINEHIGTTTSQEDKKLGYFFAKATKNEEGKHVISAEKFLSKVLFFLYGDVYKDYGFDDDIFKGEDGMPMEFSDYFDESGKAIEERIEIFLQNLKLKPIGDTGDGIEDAEVLQV